MSINIYGKDIDCTHQDCPKGLTCFFQNDEQGTHGTCVKPERSCTKNDDCDKKNCACPTGQVCNNSKCQTKCANHSDCPKDQFCCSWFLNPPKCASWLPEKPSLCYDGCDKDTNNCAKGKKCHYFRCRYPEEIDK